MRENRRTSRRGHFVEVILQISGLERAVIGICKKLRERLNKPIWAMITDLGARRRRYF